MYIPKSEYYELPNKYDGTIVRLLVQSPTRMYVYWEVSDEAIKNFESHNASYDSSIPILKIKNITMNYSYDLQIDPFTNNYYIDVKDPDCEYQVELGRKFKDDFINIYTSNLAKVPRSSPLPIKYQEEVIYRNYIRMDLTDKFTIYAMRNSHDSNNDCKQDYSNLPFSSESFDSNFDSTSFGRYENGISSMENISSLNVYADDITSFSKYEKQV